MVVFSNSKINLGLNVLEKRTDGYHNIETCYYPIPYADILEIIPSSQTRFRQSGVPIPGNDQDNLCLTAYEHLRRTYNLPPVSIHLHKIVPVGAGLGGGSSNAAFCLKLLSQMFDIGLTESELEKVAGQIGSDCPFFIRNHPVIGLGKGDEFEAIDLDLSDYHLVIVTPPIHISSSEAYSQVELTTPPGNLSNILTEQPIGDWKDLILNDFERSIFSIHPTIADLKLKLYQQGAKFSLLSGSGASVFGIFESKPALDSIDDSIQIWQGQL